ncbi:MAG: phosphonate C-P lyase system protein PhnG [Desulfuromonadales bacterium]|nr:phosphonate C-P lyase system protein PhnG [Desulfuromonadales bacterium]
MNPIMQLDIPALVSEMAPDAIEQILELAANEEIEIVRTPRSGLVMMTCRDDFDCEFHLGEVLVTDAEVACRGIRGYGMVPGDDPRRALARAAAEVICQGDNQLLMERLQRLALSEQEQRLARRTTQDQLIARSRVQFDLMSGS